MTETVATPAPAAEATTQAASDPVVDSIVDTGTPAVEPAAEATLLGGEEPAAPAAEATPIEYGDFTLAEGYAIDDADMGVLKELGQEFKLPQEAMQKLVDLGTTIQQRQAESYQAQVSDWVAQAKADKEYGGDKLQQSLSTAKGAFALPRGDKMRSLLDETGLGNHPDVIGFFAEVGKLMGNDQMVTGKSNNASKALHDIMYDKS